MCKDVRVYSSWSWVASIIAKIQSNPSRLNQNPSIFSLCYAIYLCFSLGTNLHASTIKVIVKFCGNSMENFMSAFSPISISTVLCCFLIFHEKYAYLPNQLCQIYCVCEVWLEEENLLPADSYFHFISFFFCSQNTCKCIFALFLDTMMWWMIFWVIDYAFDVFKRFLFQLLQIKTWRRWRFDTHSSNGSATAKYATIWWVTSNGSRREKNAPSNCQQQRTSSYAKH